MSPSDVADRLIGMGYLKFLSEDGWDLARQELITSLSQGYLSTEWDENCISRDKRSYPADSEELAEGRTGEFIVLMRDALTHEGVPLASVEDNFGEDRYDVVVDGKVYPIHDSQALTTWSSWSLSTKRFLEVVNDLLVRAGSRELLYGIYGGNDGRATLLTRATAL